MKKIITLLAIAFCVNANAQVCFGSYTNYHTINSPYGVAATDFNNDGKKDMAVANYGSDSLSLFINNGTGGFGTATKIRVGGGQYNILGADFNNDGNADVVAACNNSAIVLLGTGAGSFGTPTSYTVDAVNPHGLACADFNGDAILDIAVAIINSNDVSILLGDGSGGFSPSTYFPVNGTHPYSITSADFNADGKIDIATSNIDNGPNISVLLGDGTGNFGAPAIITIGNGSSPYSILSDDFNEDGKIDLATSNEGSNSVEIFLGDGAGNFSLSSSHFLVGSYPENINKGDFNNDGHMDLVTANYLLNNVSILLGTGTGSFNAASNFSAGTWPTYVTADDFNADGMLDMAVTNNSSNNVTVILGCTPTSTCIASVSFSLSQDTTVASTWDIIPQYSSQVTSAVWDWGDGTTSTGLYPSHIYSQPNFYTQCVTVYNNCGDSASTCKLDSVFRMNQANASMVYINVLHSSPTGINQLKNKNTEIKIYPSPTSSAIQVSGSNYNAEEIKICNILGDVVVSLPIERQKEITIDVSSLQNGVYFIRIGNNTQKIIVQH